MGADIDIARRPARQTAFDGDAAWLCACAADHRDCRATWRVEAGHSRCGLADVMVSRARGYNPMPARLQVRSCGGAVRRRSTIMSTLRLASRQNGPAIGRRPPRLVRDLEDGNCRSSLAQAWIPVTTVASMISSSLRSARPAACRARVASSGLSQLEANRTPHVCPRPSFHRARPMKHRGAPEPASPACPSKRDFLEAGAPSGPRAGSVV